MSEEELNQILPVVNVLPITSRKPERIKIYPNEVLITPEDSGLEKESIILCYQIKTIDKRRLIKPLGKIINPNLQDQIIEALCFQLGIDITG